jgi:hypothetical protein
MPVLILLSPNANDGVVDLAVITVNAEEQEVTFNKDDALRIGLLPLILDERENKP